MTDYAGVDPSDTATYRWAYQETGSIISEIIIGGGTHDGISQIGVQGSDYQSQTSLSGSPVAFENEVGYEILSSMGIGDDRFITETDILNVSSGSIGGRLVFQFNTSKTWANAGAIIGKCDSAGRGWQLISITDGAIAVRIKDGSNTTVSALSEGPYDDGNVHWLEFIYDWSTEQIRLRGDIDLISTEDMSSIIQATAEPTDGEKFSVLGNKDRAGLDGIIIRDLYMWEGVSSENIDDDALDDVWPLWIVTGKIFLHL